MKEIKSRTGHEPELSRPQWAWVAFWANPRNDHLRMALVEHYLPEVIRIAGIVAAAIRFRSDLDDLISAGVIGLHKAVSRYKEGDVPFSGFAYKYIRSAIYEELRSLDPLTRHQRQIFRTICAVSIELSTRLQRDPTYTEIAEEVELSVGEVEIYIGMGAETVDILGEDESGRPCLDLLPGTGLSPSEMTHRKMALEALSEAIRHLSVKEQRVIRGRNEEVPIQEIAHEMRLSKGRVTQVYQGAVHKLRRIVNNESGVSYERL